MLGGNDQFFDMDGMGLGYEIVVCIVLNRFMIPYIM